MAQLKDLEIKDKNVLDYFYPIGTIYETMNSEFDPSVEWGGTWERIKGKVLVGVDESDSSFSSSGLTGGEKEHTLTVDEIPSHRHGGMFMSYYAGNRNQIGTGSNARYINSTELAGGDGAHNNLQPYITCYMWKRTA